MEERREGGIEVGREREVEGSKGEVSEGGKFEEGRVGMVGIEVCIERVRDGRISWSCHYSSETSKSLHHWPHIEHVFEGYVTYSNDLKSFDIHRYINSIISSVLKPYK